MSQLLILILKCPTQQHPDVEQKQQVPVVVVVVGLTITMATKVQLCWLSEATREKLRGASCKDREQGGRDVKDSRWEGVQSSGLLGAAIRKGWKEEEDEDEQSFPITRQAEAILTNASVSFSHPLSWCFPVCNRKGLTAGSRLSFYFPSALLIKLVLFLDFAILDSGKVCLFSKVLDILYIRRQQ